MISPNVLRALRLIALAEADEQSLEAWYKSVCRWYSREFHTPLQQVLEMSDEYVLATYYEDVFWKLRTGSDSQVEAFDKIVDAVLAEESPEAAETEDEDEDWYQQELQNLDEQLAKKSEKTRETGDVARDGKLMPEPNLPEEDRSVRVDHVDDPIPDDEGF